MELPHPGELLSRLPGRFIVVLPDPPEFTIVAITAGCRSALRLMEDDPVGRGLFHALGTSDQDVMEDVAAGLRVSLERALRRRAADRMPVHRIPAAADAVGDAFWAITCTPVTSAGGDVDLLVVEIADVTELRRQAAADADAARATAEIALLEAEEAARAKTSFLANMSHELRTPLNAIQGYVQLLQIGVAGPLSDAHQNYLERIRSSGVHLKALVDDVLDIARADAGQLQVTRELAYTGDAVAAAQSLTTPQARNRNVTLVEERADVSLPYVGDESRVRQILINLLDNAIKFTPAGGRVTIACHAEEEPPEMARLSGAGPWTCITVSDTGIGIPVEHHRTIFEPFVQVDDRLTRSAGGTGLGLTISRRLARLMGGDLTVRSEPGRGSTFQLWLPTSAGQAERGASSSARRARALQETAGSHVHGFGKIARRMRRDTGAIVDRWVRLVKEDEHMVNARSTDSPLIEDHYPTFIVNLAQNLLTIEESEGVESGKLQDGGEIQRSIADLHGAQRFRLEWSEQEVAREYTILLDVLAYWFSQLDAHSDWDIPAASDVIRHLVERGRDTSLAAWRRASLAQR